ncbi:MAG: hypothetical protein WCK70_16520 [Chloroflexales bacterium]
MVWLLHLLRTPLLWIATRLAFRRSGTQGTAGSTALHLLPRQDYIGKRLQLGIRWAWLRWPLALELMGIGLWAAWVGRTYLDFDSHTWPSGGEFPMSIQGNIVWTWLFQCGDCVLWNGSIKGGSPAFIDLHGAVTHPLVVLTTLLWGFVVGAKVTLVICLFLAGLAQWWLARILQVGRFARLWSAVIAVVAGHLAGRMEIGVFGVVLSTACGSLSIVAGIALARDGRRFSTVRLAALLALTIMAGQGYIQLGMIVALLPAFGVLLIDENLRIRPVWREFAIAGGIALLLSGIFVVPLAHFWTALVKDIDPTFASAQPVGYGPLNLVIHDEMFYRTQFLGKQPYPYLYITYIGWIPVLLAMASLRLTPKNLSQMLLFFLVAISLIYLTSSAIPFSLLLPIAPEFMAGVRNPALIAGLAIPLILGMSALGLDALLRIDKFQIALLLRGAYSGTLNVMGLLILPALWSIWPAYHFNQQWFTTFKLDPLTHSVARYLITPTVQWVQSPYGEGFWLSELLTSGAKIANVTRPWNWRERDNPPPSREIARNPGTMDTGIIERQVYDMAMIVYPTVHYAMVTNADGVTPCTAEALGGHIDVVCESNAPGKLVVREHADRGWYVTVDDTPAQLTGSSWLEMPSVVGVHRYSFRYRPWDVPVGVLLSLMGVAAAWKHAATAPPDKNEESPHAA